MMRSGPVPTVTGTSQRFRSAIDCEPTNCLCSNTVSFMIMVSVGGPLPSDGREVAATAGNDAVHTVVARQLAHSVAECALGEVGEREERALPLRPSVSSIAQTLLAQRDKGSTPAASHIGRYLDSIVSCSSISDSAVLLPPLM
jgi:hypothetical protein